MLVSFCVIAHNEENTLPSLFKDICMQDYPHKNMEIILIDSQSTDNTKFLMEDFAKSHNDFARIAICDNLKKIQAAGWNVAISNSKGDIIIRIDAHTHIPESFVTKNVNCLKNGEYISGGPRPSIAGQDTPWQHTLLLAEKSMFGSSIAAYRRKRNKTYVKSVFHGAYRREVFDKVGGFDERLGRTEDNEMHYRITKAGFKICYNPDIISYQHIRNNWRKMIKQKYENGYWIGLTLGICPRCFSLYHFVPLYFVLMLFLLAILFFKGIKYPIILLFIIYFCVDIIMSFLAIIKEKKYWQYVMLPIIFLSLHLSYGVGTLWGIIKMPFWKLKNSE